MKNTTIFCLTLDPEHEKIIKKLSYVPVGLGEKKFSQDCFNDKNGMSIAYKNSFYGEYTFHYWIWKNYLNKIDTEWVGFCQYRKFFLLENSNFDIAKFEDLEHSILKEIDNKNNNYDCVLGEKFSVKNYKFSKIFKNHFSEFLSKPELFFNKDKRNLKFHFDLFHGKGNLDLATNQLDEKNKKKFTDFMINNNSFNPHNMFICKTNILKNYYEIIFPWLEKCEKIFGFNNLNNYGMKRIYGFLAERFLSYWFNENYKVKENPILVKDISIYKNL